MATPVDSFIEITGWTQGRESAQQFIDTSGGRIETALSLYFEDPAPTPSSRAAPSRASAPASPPPRSLLEELNDEYSRDLVQAKAPRVPPNPDIYVVKLPAVLSLAMYPVGKLLNLFWAPSPAPALPAAASEAYFKQNVVPVVARHGGAPPDSFLSKATYLDAVERAKRELKYLLVVVTSDVHEVRPQDYIEQLLATGVPTRAETLVWFGSIARSEGYRVALGFGAVQYPFTVLIAASPRTAVSSTIVMEALLSHSGPFAGAEDAQRFAAKAEEVVQLHEPKLLALRLERRRFDADRELRDQQDSAYQQSLEMDRRRAAEALERERAGARQARQLATWQRRVFARAARYDGATDGARVGLRLPSGQRLTLHFPGAAPLSDIYDVAYARLHADPVLGDAADEDEDLDGFEPPYEFVLKSPALRRAVEASATAVEDEPAVWPNGVLVVDVD